MSDNFNLDWEAFTNASSNPTILLFVKDKKIITINANFWQRLKYFFHKRKLANFLKDNKDELIEHANNNLTAKIPVNHQQKFINRLFENIGKPSEAPDLHENYNKNWMSQLPEEAKKKPINELLLPGSHDSGAYKIDYDRSFSKKRGLKIISWFAKKIPFVRHSIENWTLTQDKTIYEQLNCGIRKLDFRITYHDDEDRFYLAHSFTCVALEEVLEDMKKFLNENEEEVIILSVKPDYPERNTMEPIEINDKALKIFKEILGEKIFEKEKEGKINPEINLNFMKEHRKQLILSYEGESNNINNHAWPSNLTDEHWHETKSFNANKKINSVNSVIEKLQYSQNCMHGVGFNGTPSPSDVAKSVFLNNNIRLFSNKVNPKAEALLKNKHRNISFFNFDFVRGDLAENIINFNRSESQMAYKL